MESVLVSEDIQKTLFRPFEIGAIEISDNASILSINAYTPICDDLKRYIRHFTLAQWQPYRPSAIKCGLEKEVIGGVEVPDAKSLYQVFDAKNRYDLILFNQYREVDRTDLLRAIAANRLSENGILLCSASNTLGAKKFQKHFELLCRSPVNSLSKHKCRATWTTKGNFITSMVDTAKLLEFQTISENYVSLPGVFSAGKIDVASKFLISTLVEEGISFDGEIYDLGGGWGYLTAELLRHGFHGKFTILEADAEALLCAQRNLADWNVTLRWIDVVTETPHLVADVVVMNPPFHLPTETDPDLGRDFIRAAFNVLKPSGVLWMVANVHLAYEALLREIFIEAEIVSEKHGFKVIRAVKS